MKILRKLAAALGLALILSGVVGAALPASTGLVATARAASKAKLSETCIDLAVGNTFRLKVTGTKRKVAWSSSNKRVAKVSRKGLVTAVKPGKAKIVAKVGKKKLVCKVTVTEFPVLVPFPVVVVKKPILYLYPEEETELTVKLGKPEILTAAYPAYADGWRVLARPDGTLTDLETGRSLYALYWEGESDAIPPMDEGFVVAGADTAAFLEEKLAALGLTEREAEEFIVYWLPSLQKNPYNLIRFERPEEIDATMPLEFSVAPDTLIRVYMAVKPLEAAVDIPEQTLPEPPAREGFTAVEWGGTELN